jgi:hypothetical protein
VSEVWLEPRHDPARWTAGLSTTAGQETRLTASVAYNYALESRPNFAAPIYLACKWVIKEGGVPADAPPMFILAATDDPLKLAPESVALYQD